MRFAHGEAITVQRAATTTDDYGNEIEDWSAPTETTIEGCALAPRYEAEGGGADNPTVIVGFQLFAPYGSDIKATDRIVARGETFEIDGEPGDWANPFTGTEFGMEVALRRVEGV